MKSTEETPLSPLILFSEQPDYLIWKKSGVSVALMGKYIGFWSSIFPLSLSTWNLYGL